MSEPTYAKGVVDLLRTEIRDLEGENSKLRKALSQLVRRIDRLEERRVDATVVWPSNRTERFSVPDSDDLVDLLGEADEIREMLDVAALREPPTSGEEDE